MTLTVDSSNKAKVHMEVLKLITLGKSPLGKTVADKLTWRYSLALATASHGTSLIDL